MVKNTAFVFIKPAALTDKVKELVTEVFAAKSIEIKKEGQLEAKEIDEKTLIDKHYYAIASKATLLTPDKLNIPENKFKEKFGLEWKDVLKDEKALNAKDCCAKFEIDGDKLDSMWGAAKKSGNLVKFGGGFYCAKLENPKDKVEFYVFNGFFMSMRATYVAEGAAIYYYVVEWESEALCWSDFRGKVLGPTDPSEAPADSLRGKIYKQWKDLGLKAEPNTGENSMHASASPFEGLAERDNWLGYRADRDPFGKLLLKTGVSRKQIKEWTLDPQVTFGPIAMTKSLYDSVEDTDTDMCLALLQMIGNCCQPKDKAEDLEKTIEKLKEQLESYKPLEKAVLAIQAYVAPPPPKKVKEEKSKAKAAEPPKPEPKASKKGKGKGSKRDDSEDYYEEKPPMRKGKGGGKGGGGGGGGGGGKGGGKGKGKGKGKR